MKGERKPMVCCKTPIHISCLREWFRANSSTGVHPACPHCKKEVNRILNSIRIPNVLTISIQRKLLGCNVMMGIIKDMYKAYSDLIEKGLRNRLQAFSFRNIDSIFLDPIELDNNGNIFSGFENRFVNMVFDYIKTDYFRKQFVSTIVSQIPGWCVPIQMGYVQNLFYSNSSTTILELKPTIFNLNGYP